MCTFVTLSYLWANALYWIIFSTASVVILFVCVCHEKIMFKKLTWMIIRCRIHLAALHFKPVLSYYNIVVLLFGKRKTSTILYSFLKMCIVMSFKIMQILLKLILGETEISNYCLHSIFAVYYILRTSLDECVQMSFQLCKCFVCQNVHHGKNEVVYDTVFSKT
jgi:hypothetical protein